MKLPIRLEVIDLCFSKVFDLKAEYKMAMLRLMAKYADSESVEK